MTSGPKHYNDTINMNVRATADGGGAHVTFFSLSLIGGALGDAGQNYKNIVQLFDATFGNEYTAPLVHADGSCPDPAQ